VLNRGRKSEKDGGGISLFLVDRAYSFVKAGEPAGAEISMASTFGDGQRDVGHRGIRVRPGLF
jgi:hypothetical protein